MKRQRSGGAPGGHQAAGDALGATQAVDATANVAQDGALGVDEAGGAELLEDRTVRISGGGRRRPVSVSLPGAVVGSLLVAALALGSALGPRVGDFAGTGHDGEAATLDPTAAPAPVHGADAYTIGTGPDGFDAGGSDAGEVEPGAEGTDGAVDGSSDEPSPTDAAPDATVVDLGLGLDGNAVVVEWGACATDGFLGYKVVRSTDDVARWPMGSGDTLAGAIESEATTRFVDSAVERGRTYSYRVVALRAWSDQTVIACRTEVKAISTPAPTPAPKPAPADGTGMSLSVSLKEGHPFIDWSECSGLEFDYYKVVRSTDSTVTWPRGENDSLVTAIGKDGQTKAWDGEAPAGTVVYYRVFCVRSSGDGYVVVTSTAVKGIETPAADPPPDPVALGFEVDVTGEGVVLHWEACTSDSFAFYKVVRSTTTESPSYLPYHDGTEVIGVFESSAKTQMTDGAVSTGQTIYYRVQSIGTWNGQKVLLGQTAVIAVTIP